jgi:starch phosphorylase
MAASIAHLGAVFNTHRMVLEYADHAYFPAHRAGAAMASNDHLAAEELAQWRTRAAAAWPGVSVRSQLASEITSLRVGTTVRVDIWATLNGLDPQDVTVEALAGRPGPTGEPVDTTRITAVRVGTEGGEERYLAEVPLELSGDLALSVRVRGTNGAMAANPYRQLLLCRE